MCTDWFSLQCTAQIVEYSPKSQVALRVASNAKSRSSAIVSNGHAGWRGSTACRL